MEDIGPYDRRVAETPHDGAAYASRGKCHLRNGDYALGRLDLEKALEFELDPDAPPDERGIRYERPNTSDVHLQLGAALVELGELEAAARHMELGWQLDGSEAAYTARGAVKLLRGDARGALADLSIALSKNPRSERALKHRAACHEELGAAPAAEADRAALALLVEQRMALPHSWLQRGFEQEKLGRLDAALASFQKYAQLLPAELQGPLQQGRLLLGAERLSEAAPLLEQALSLAPHDVSVRYHLGLLLLKRGDARAALEHFDVGLPLAESWYAGFRPLILRERGRAQQILGNTKAAAADFEAATAAEQA